MSDALPPQIIDLTPYYGVIRISGPAALSFLQGQLTCDVQEISSSVLRLGGFCTPQGRLRALFKIFKKSDPVNNQEIFYLQLPKSLLAVILASLKKYVLFSKVTIEEEQDSQIFGWQEEDGWLASSNTEQNLLNFLKREAAIEENSLSPITLLRAPGSLPRFQIIGSAAMNPLWEKLSQRAMFHDFNEWRLWDIRQGIPEIWPETTEQFFPHHLNLPNLEAVSFTKGCYCGQEIIARMHYRGTIKRRMVRGILADCHDQAMLAAGTELFLEHDQADTLKVITVAPSPSTSQVEALIEIPHRVLAEQMEAQTFKVQPKESHSLKELIVQPFLTGCL